MPHSEIKVSNAGFKVRTKRKSRWCRTSRAPKGRRDITWSGFRYEHRWRRYTLVGPDGNKT